jgi:hypothetical protein
MRRELPALPPEAEDQDGEFTYQQAMSAGWSPWDIQRGIDGAALAVLATGVYIPAHLLDDLTRDQRHCLDVRARLLSSPTSWYAARRSAATYWGLPLIGYAPNVPQLVRDPDGTKGKAVSRHERIAKLHADDRVVTNGVALTSLARTVVDISRQEVFRNGVVIADAALHAGVPKEAMLEVLSRMRRWPGVIRAREVVEFADARTESPGESLTRVAMRAENIRIPEPQVEVWRYGKLLARLDFCFRDQLLAVEFDGAIKFTDLNVVPALLGRAEEVRDCGIGVLHTNWNETFSRTEAFGSRVKARLREPRQLAPGVELRSTWPTFEVAA